MTRRVNGRPPHRPPLRGAGLPGLQPPRGSLDPDGRLVDGARHRARPRGHRAADAPPRDARGGDRGGVFALGAAGLSKGIRRQARAACEDYFYNRLGLTPSHELGGPEEIPEGLELMPDAMYRALEDIVELVVDGDYEELRDLSRNRLEIEDLRRRVEDDCPESLVLPPREIYRVETITKSDDPEHAGLGLLPRAVDRDRPGAPAHRGRARGVGRALHGDARRHPALIRPLTRKAHPWVDSRPSEDQAAYAGRGRSVEGLALRLPSLSDPTR